VLQRAKIRAIQLKTSVNAVLARYLETFAEQLDVQDQAVGELLALADENDDAGARRRAKQRGRRRWTRDELHER
jgi:hypothetical protein